MTDIKASDLGWAKVTFSDKDDALLTLDSIEKEIKHIKALVDNPDITASEALKTRLANLEEAEEELVELLFQDIADLT